MHALLKVADWKRQAAGEDTSVEVLQEVLGLVEKAKDCAARMY